MPPPPDTRSNWISGWLLRLRPSHQDQKRPAELNEPGADVAHEDQFGGAFAVAVAVRSRGGVFAHRPVVTPAAGT